MWPNKQWEHFRHVKPHIYRRHGMWWMMRVGWPAFIVISDDCREAMDAFREECGKSRAI